MSVDLFGRRIDSGATFSPCGRYRYRLWRQFGDGPTATFVMLNPSTADEEKNDPTVAKCVEFAKRWKYAVPRGLASWIANEPPKPKDFKPYGRVEVVNIFAWRSTDPIAMKAVADPIGPENDAAILAACMEAALVVVAWGKHGAHRDRGRAVARMLSAVMIYPFCFKHNEDGSPMHPLYVGLGVEPVPFEFARYL